ncbi:16S rRNA (guanine(966)-N(2))-methyltransferase [hydrothermal vent metagenome]|uniref:16S rRNA (Guanine(966)-N(2))-methyltransferase n=1 Tax=hydrothermal vent metagenome TaxID=652676 RepID=A0A3B1BS28_9ZZZZ
MRRKKAINRSRASAQRNQLRIIGGDWRGRKLGFPDLPGLRPTPDRVRETLFNWLTPMIRHASCLDLFSGSGALGLEALSRGAAKVVLVDSQPPVIASLQQNIAVLQAGERVCLQQCDARQYLQSLTECFDLIFLDPPYHQNLLQPCIDSLYQQKALKPQGYLYFEANRDEALPQLPAAWAVYRQKSAGQIVYCLVRYADQG